MTQVSYFWDGASLGDAQNAPYHLANADYESPFVDVFLRTILNGDEDRGVLKGWANELEPTCAGGTTPVQIDTGGAVVYGMPYENTAAVNVAITTPTTDVRYDRIVLRRNWAAQTIRITLITGVEGGSAPAMTQSVAPGGSGVYDIPLAIVETDIGGNITVTDDRDYCTYSLEVADSSITTAMIQDDAVTAAKQATRTKRIFVGGGDLHPAEGGWSCTGGTTISTGAGIAWGTHTLLGIDCWIITLPGVAWSYGGGVTAGIYVPQDYASGAITCYVWWSPDGVDTSDWQFLIGHKIGDGLGTYEYNWCYQHDMSYSAANILYRTSVVGIPASDIAGPGDFILSRVTTYAEGSAPSGDLGIIGIEYVYTGYL